MKEPEKCPTCASDDKTIHRGYQCDHPDCPCTDGYFHECENDWHREHDHAPAATTKGENIKEVMPNDARRKSSESQSQRNDTPGDAHPDKHAVVTKGETNDAGTIQGSSQPTVGNLRDVATNLCGERILPRTETVAPVATKGETDVRNSGRDNSDNNSVRTNSSMRDPDGSHLAVAPEGTSAAEFYREWSIKGNEEFCDADEELGCRFAEAYAQPLRDEIQRLDVENSQFNQALNQALSAIEAANDRTEQAEADHAEMRDALREVMGELATTRTQLMETRKAMRQLMDVVKPFLVDSFPKSAWSREWERAERLMTPPAKAKP